MIDCGCKLFWHGSLGPRKNVLHSLQCARKSVKKVSKRIESVVQKLKRSIRFPVVDLVILGTDQITPDTVHRHGGSLDFETEPRERLSDCAAGL